MYVHIHTYIHIIYIMYVARHNCEQPIRRCNLQPQHGKLSRVMSVPCFQLWTHSGSLTVRTHTNDPSSLADVICHHKVCLSLNEKLPKWRMEVCAGKFHIQNWTWSPLLTLAIRLIVRFCCTQLSSSWDVMKWGGVWAESNYENRNKKAVVERSVDAFCNIYSFAHDALNCSCSEGTLAL